jgi:hypothetical protein
MIGLEAGLAVEFSQMACKGAKNGLIVGWPDQIAVSVNPGGPTLTIVWPSG